MHTYKYPRPALTVDAIIIGTDNEERKILLVRRANEPYKDKWALPGGFVDIHETLEESCSRELSEETGLTINGLSQFRVYDAVDRDPRGRTISVVFAASVAGFPPVLGDDDASEAAWFNIGELPVLAFDHKQIIDDYFGNELNSAAPAFPEKP